MLCIIPARGGSKRIPAKNIKNFLDLPIIAYSIRAALESGIFSEVMVSTDSEEIAQVARKMGAEVPFMRSEKAADDYATTADVVHEVLEQYKALGKQFEAFAVVYATAPFISADTLRKGKDLLDSGHKAAFTCVEYSYPIQRALIINNAGNVEMREPQYRTSRSQDLAKTYHDAGQCYLSRVDTFESCGSLWGPDTAPIILDNLEVQDIDTPQDWQLAEIKYRLLHLSHSESASHCESESSENLDILPFILVPYQNLSNDDKEKMRTGRNLPEIREKMVDTKEISKENHLNFIANLPNRSDKAYYALYIKNGEENELIGSVTLTYFDDNTAERGIWLFPEAQGYGYARAALSKLYESLHRQGINSVYTRVRRDNAPSNSLEEYLGATPIPASEYDTLPAGMLPTDSDMLYYVCKF